MEHFVEGFKQLGLPAVSPRNYKNAEQYARSFQKCTALKTSNISYSSSLSEYAAKNSNEKPLFTIY